MNTKESMEERANQLKSISATLNQDSSEVDSRNVTLTRLLLRYANEQSKYGRKNMDLDMAIRNWNAFGYFAIFDKLYPEGAPPPEIPVQMLYTQIVHPGKCSYPSI